MSRVDDNNRRSTPPSPPAHKPEVKSAESKAPSAAKPSEPQGPKANTVAKSQVERQFSGQSSFETRPSSGTASRPALTTPSAPGDVSALSTRGTASPSTFTAQALPSPTGSERVATAAATAVAPQPLNPQSVAAANRDYDANKNSGAATTALFIGLMDQHKSDPDYVAQLVNRAKESSPGVLDYMMGGLNGAFQKDSGGYYAGFSDAGRQTIVDSLNTARAKGTLSDQEIRDHAAYSPGWQDVAQRMNVSQVGHDPSTEAATTEVAAAQATYNSATQDVQKKDERLAKELANFGPALTDQQRAGYIKAFRDDPANKEAYAKQAQAAEALAQSLSKNREALERASISEPRVREQLYTALKDVASSATPKAALEVYADINKDPNSPLGQAFSQYSKIDEEVLSPALSGAAGQLMAENGGNTQSAFAELQKLMAPIMEAKEQYATPAGEVRESANDIKEAWNSISEAAKGNLHPLEELAEDWKAVGEAKGPLAKGLASAGLVFGAAGVVGDTASGIDSLKKGEYAKAVESFASAGQDGLEIVAGATKALADTGKLAEYTGKALGFAEFAAKLAPGLGIVANGAAFASHLSEAAESHNAGYALATVGDALGVLGSALELVPGGEPAGVIIGGIGNIISTVSEVAGDFIEKKGFEDEQKRFLTAANVPEDLRQLLFDANGDRVRELSKDLHLTPTQIQDLTRTYPNLLEGTGRGVVLDNLKKMTSSLGLNNTQVYDLIKSIGNGTNYKADALEVFFNRLSRDLYPQNGQEWLDAVHQIATDPRNADSLQLTFGNVDRYLQSQIQGPPSPPRP